MKWIVVCAVYGRDIQRGWRRGRLEYAIRRWIDLRMGQAESRDRIRRIVDARARLNLPPIEKGDR